jgi:RimK family alpha-L-glutamate ligase
MNKIKIALFFGGKISQHLVLIKKAAKKLGVRLDLVSYNRVCFDTESLKVIIRGNINDQKGRTHRSACTLENKIKNEGWLQIDDYDVLFFRTTGKHWEEVDLILRQAQDKQVIVDPIIKYGKPSMACKAYQMLELKKAGIDVPKTIYGSLWYLYECMKNNDFSCQQIFSSGESATQASPKGTRFTAQCQKKLLTSKNQFVFPVIIKGSGGDRGTRVFKANNLEEMEGLVRKLRKSETDEGKRYMLQEYIPNDGDFRVLVLGEKVLGVMRRSSGKESEFRNNYSAGGTVEVAILPENVLELAVKAAKVCGLAVAGVDVAFRNYDINKPVIWEVNKGPQFKGFMKATGINVPEEIVKFLVNLSDNSR